MKICNTSTGLLILALALAVAVSSAGCIAMIQKNTGQSPAPAESYDPAPESGSVPAETPAGFSGPGLSSAGSVAPPPATVLEVAPDIMPDPYPVLHGTRINQTGDYSRLGSTGYDFEKTYFLRANATGLLVNVTKAPLYIIYEVNPLYDCLKEPANCRGDSKKPVNRPYLTITVRDNGTREILAEDGYAREYSSDTGNYEFQISGKNTDGLLSSGGSTGTNYVTPGPRVIRIFRDGKFHITIEGNFLSVTMKIRTGATPAQPGAAAPGTPVPAPEEEVEF